MSRWCEAGCMRETEAIGDKFCAECEERLEDERTEELLNAGDNLYRLEDNPMADERNEVKWDRHTAAQAAIRDARKVTQPRRERTS